MYPFYVPDEQIDNGVFGRTAISSDIIAAFPRNVRIQFFGANINVLFSSPTAPGDIVATVATGV